MDSVVPSFFLVAAVAAPVGAFLYAVRQPQTRLRDLLIRPALAGFLVGVLFFAASLILVDWRLAGTLALYPWLLVFTIQGAAVGVLGALARLIGGWRPSGSVAAVPRRTGGCSGHTRVRNIALHVDEGLCIVSAPKRGSSSECFSGPVLPLGSVLRLEARLPVRPVGVPSIKWQPLRRGMQ